MKADIVEKRLSRLEELLKQCSLCGRRCKVDRFENSSGFCRTDSVDRFHARIASNTLHFGEEPMIVGDGGSGTVFFSHCNLRCLFCQNFQISQQGMGEDVHYSELAKIFLELQSRGAENINLVTPTHYIFPILLALREAYNAGLSLPLVYNTNGYDSVELVRLLDGVVDVYLPDLKYMDEGFAAKYSSGKDYPSTAMASIKEMWRQTGPLLEENGVAKRGTIIRHLILPENIAGSYEFLLWLKDEEMLDATLSIMSQYSPRHRAEEFPELRNLIAREEYENIVRYALDLGFENVLAQGIESSDLYLPDFEKEEPFSN
jgi:putative pyruvate formate lyase activating enzyme